VFGSFFLINLILAAIMDSFYKVDREIAVDELKKEFRDVEQQAKASLREKLQDRKTEEEKRGHIPTPMAGGGEQVEINESIVNSLLTDSIDLSAVEESEERKAGVEI
jgi:hypothetical protein